MPGGFSLPYQGGSGKTYSAAGATPLAKIQRDTLRFSAAPLLLG